jgi:hypothetical protein
MRHLSTCARALVLAGATTLLVACGGGGGDSNAGSGAPTVPGTGMPGSATTSVAGLIAFMQSLIAATDETSDPVGLGNAALASSETDEPVAKP